MMQRFAFLLLAALIALDCCTAGASLLMKRETNGERFNRGLPPLPPTRRSGTSTAKRSQVSPVPGGTSGRLKVRLAVDGTTLGYVANNGIVGPTGLRLSSDPTQPDDFDLQVEFSGSSLLAKDPQFPPPCYIGGYGARPLAVGSTNTIEFINVPAGPSAAIWTLDAKTGMLNATWTNPDGSKIQPTLVYDVLLNAFNFTGDSDPTALYNLNRPPAQYPVHISTSP